MPFGFLQKVAEWSEWHATVLQDRNKTENVYRWACGYVSLFPNAYTIKMFMSRLLQSEKAF